MAMDIKAVIKSMHDKKNRMATASLGNVVVSNSVLTSGYGIGQTSNYGAYGEDTTQFTIKKVTNGHVITAHKHDGMTGALTKEYCRVVPAGGDMLGEIAAIMADMKMD